MKSLNELVTDAIYEQLEQCQTNIDQLLNIIASLQNLLMRRQEDEEKLAQMIYNLQEEQHAVFSQPCWDTSSLAFFETDD